MKGERAFQKEKADRAEAGSITLLLVGLCAILLLIAAVTMAITAVHIERQKLQSLADQTSSAVAVSIEEFELEAQNPLAAMSDEHVQATSLQFLNESGAHASFDRLAITENTGSEAGTTAKVELTSYARIPLVAYVLPQGVQIRVSSSARATLEQ